MSILTDLINKKITFAQAATKAEGWVSNIVGKDASLQVKSSAVLSNVKQAASNAVAIGDTVLGDVIGPATTGTEVLLEAALAKATGGVSVAFNPLISAGVSSIASAVKAQVDAWELETLGKLAGTPTPAPAAATPPAAAAAAIAPKPTS